MSTTPQRVIYAEGKGFLSPIEEIIARLYAEHPDGGLAEVR